MAANAALIISLALLGAGGAPAKQTLAYRVTPEVRDGELHDLMVEISLSAGPDGRTRLDLPDRGQGETGQRRSIYDLAVTGATMSEDGPGRRVLASRPNAAIKVRYRVRSADGADPGGAGGGPDKGAVIRPDGFATLGESTFITPEGRESARVTFRWGPLPRGWKAGSDLDGGRGRRPTVADLSQSLLMGGSDVRLIQKRLPKGRLQIALRGQWSFSDKGLADDIGRVVLAQRRFWGEEGGPYFVSLAPMAGSNGGSSVGGTSRYEGFALFATPDVTVPMLRRVLVREPTHAWILRRQGRSADGAPDAAESWFSEGFTEFYTARILLRAGLWSPQDYLAHVNAVLRRYDESPVRSAPNSRIVSDFGSDPSLRDLAGLRGFLLALLWDRTTRQASDGRAGLDAIMLQMRDRWAAGLANDKTTAVVSFLQKARDVAGLDLDDDYRRYVIEGAEIRLPADLFGACATLTTVPRPHSAGAKVAVQEAALATGLSTTRLSACRQAMSGAG